MPFLCLLASLKVWVSHIKRKVEEHSVSQCKEISPPITAFLRNPPLQKSCRQLYGAV